MWDLQRKPSPLSREMSAASQQLNSRSHETVLLAPGRSSARQRFRNLLSESDARCAYSSYHGLGHTNRAVVNEAWHGECSD